jgi:hypothetical protein
VVLWDNIKDDHPCQLKVSPVAAISHKSRAYRLILNLFTLHIEDGVIIELVKDITEKGAPHGAIDQIGHSLKRIIHAFAEVDEDTVILMTKWDIQHGFWPINFCKGEEYNFCYVWPQAPGKPQSFVVPSSLQMGWVELAPYFCASSETAQDITIKYIETAIGSLSEHKFEAWAGTTTAIINNDTAQRDLRYVLEVYVDDYISCVNKLNMSQEEFSMEYTTFSHQAWTTARTQSWQRSSAKVTAHLKLINAS